MTTLQELLEGLIGLLPMTLVTGGIIAGLLLMRWVLFRRPSRGQVEGNHHRRQLVMFTLGCGGLVAIVLALPVEQAVKGELLSLFGLLLTAAITLSSTTLVGNAMAGIMLRTINNFKPGDFVQVGPHFGRVSGQGIFHIELQTEDRDLMTLPNMFLVTQPVKVTRASGTAVSATITLGYDVAWTDIEALLLQAAAKAGLEDPFVRVLALGDFAVEYRVAGLLKAVRTLLTVQSRLRTCMLDALHEGGVEIVSPTFMNQRALPTDVPVVPKTGVRPRRGADLRLEALVFDKAEAAATVAFLRQELRSLEQRHVDLTTERDKLKDERLRRHLKYELEHVEARRAQMQEALTELEAE